MTPDHTTPPSGTRTGRRSTAPPTTHLKDARLFLANAKRALRNAQEQAADEHTLKVAGRGERLVDQAIRQAREGERHSTRSTAR